MSGAPRPEPRGTPAAPVFEWRPASAEEPRGASLGGPSTSCAVPGVGAPGRRAGFVPVWRRDLGEYGALPLPAAPAPTTSETLAGPPIPPPLPLQVVLR